MIYEFQESKIFEGGFEKETPDPYGEKALIKSTSEKKARRRLPVSETGRKWVLVKSYHQALHKEGKPNGS